MVAFSIGLMSDLWILDLFLLDICQDLKIKYENGKIFSRSKNGILSIGPYNIVESVNSLQSGTSSTSAGGYSAGLPCTLRRISRKIELETRSIFSACDTLTKLKETYNVTRKHLSFFVTLTY